MVTRWVVEMKLFISFLQKIKKSLHTDRSGLTLVEVIVSIALLGIVVILISDMLMTAFTITAMNLPKTKNSLNVGGTVATASVPAGQSAVTNGGVTVSTNAGNVTVDFSGGNTSQVAGTYENGSTDSSTSSNYTTGAWTFIPN
jgi:prepilin-type N-terminal cleavage/methylation domain-containing protein